MSRGSRCVREGSWRAAWGLLAERHLHDEGMDVTGAHCWAGSPEGLAADWGTPPRRATACPAHLALSAERQNSALSCTHGTLFGVLSFQKPPARHQPLLPSSAGALQGLTQRARPLGPGRSHWAGPQGSGRRAVLAFPRAMPSQHRRGCPAGPLSTCLALIYPVSTLPASRGTEFIFHNSSTREGGISPFPNVDTEAQRGAATCSRSHSGQVVKVEFGLQTIGTQSPCSS